MTPDSSFSGEYTRKVDGKKRGLLPRDLVRVLDERYGSRRIVIVDFKTHLRLYPAAAWPLQQDIIREHMPPEDAERAVRSAYETTVQSNGRFQIRETEFLRRMRPDRQIRIVGHPSSIRVEWLPDPAQQLELAFPPQWEQSLNVGEQAPRRPRGRPRKKRAIVELPLADLIWPDDKYRVRDDAAIGDLVESLRREGQKLPIYVLGERPYRVIAGHRRVEALHRLGAPTVRAIILPRMKEQDAQKLALIDNLDRRALNEADVLVAVRKFRDRGMKAPEIAALLRRKVRTAQRLLKLADAPEPILDAVRSGKLTLSAAYEVHARGIPLEAVAGASRGRPPSVRSLKKWGADRRSVDTRRRGAHVRRFKNGGIKVSVHVHPGASEEQRREAEKALADALSEIRSMGR